MEPEVKAQYNNVVSELKRRNAWKKQDLPYSIRSGYDYVLEQTENESVGLTIEPMSVTFTNDENAEDRERTEVSSSPNPVFELFKKLVLLVLGQNVDSPVSIKVGAHTFNVYGNSK